MYTKEQLVEMLKLEEENLKKFSQDINAELAFRQGRIKLLVELLQKEETNGITEPSE
jgi:hypothetical protein